MPDTNARDRFITANGLRLHYLEWGEPSSRPLILLHHVGSHAHTWDDFARAMSADFHVIALDLRGHGDSAWAPGGAYRTEDYAKDVAALAEELALAGAVVLGGSLGGRVGLLFAADHPERVAALLMEDVGAVRPPGISQRFADRLAAGDPRFDRLEDWASHLRGGNDRPPDEVFMHLAEHGTTRLEDGHLGLKRDPATLRDLVTLELWDYVERLRAPLLLLIGSESEIVGPDQRDRFRALVPDASIETIEEAGHIIVHDQPGAFEAVVRSFLRSHSLL